jgi:uncharacterized protein (TIGR02246 family)
MRNRVLYASLAPALLIALGTWAAPGQARAQATTKPAAPQAKGAAPKAAAPQTKGAAPAASDRAQDQDGIRATLRSLVQAFGAGDAKAAAALWTDNGEFVREGEGAIQGREALEKGFAAILARKDRPKVSVEPGPVRFLSRDLALDEGKVTVRGGPDDPALTSDYSVLLVREDGKWRIAQLRESPAEEATSLQDLAWLVGDWRSAAGEAAEILTTYSWAENKKFLQVKFTIREKDRALSGFQVIGVDPATKELRAWTFEAEGGIVEATWRRDGEHWTAEAVGTLADGRTLTAVNILRRINEDTFTWQSTQRALDDEGLPDLPPTKVTRVKSAK